ncbi:hypothetical protein ILUMI_23527 [Ignelater luminosus]|uniref:Uncharacterized protein n=1 Tax=Ignelater luminosus TaxID=2038154 RepID=A0A8K0CDS1_IGNLU|nr:hypothetical protein ILUMI_23527 [Ignelater luminosus]
MYVSSNTVVTLTIDVFYYLLIFALLLWYTYWRLSRKHLLELAAKLPGPKGWPIIGNALDFTGTSPGMKQNKLMFFFL